MLRAGYLFKSYYFIQGVFNSIYRIRIAIIKCIFKFQLCNLKFHPKEIAPTQSNA